MSQYPASKPSHKAMASPAFRTLILPSMSCGHGLPSPSAFQASGHTLRSELLHVGPHECWLQQVNHKLSSSSRLSAKTRAAASPGR